MTYLSKAIDTCIQKEAKKMVALLVRANDSQPDSPVTPMPRRRTINVLEEVRRELETLLEGV